MTQPSGPGAVALPRMPPTPMPRPQVSIERLPTRRLSNEPRESMNCKSCRKRKIKCNRLRPACEACQVFQCPCIYDAVPKKRGPKTDVLEALLKRVDGLEARLKDKNARSDTTASANASASAPGASTSAQTTSSPTSGGNVDAAQGLPNSATSLPTPKREPSPEVDPDTLLDIYFNRFHDKPFHLFDESTLRQRLHLNQVPSYLVHAIYAVAARYAPHPSGYQSAVKLADEYADRSRREVDTDEPSVDALQALVLLVTAFTASGKGKRAYMLLTSAVGMAMALELHRETDNNACVTPIERETRRRLFWSCYLLDRFMSCGSKRPCLISDRAILLRLPCWFPSPATLPIEGEFFQSYTNLQHLQGGGRRSQGSSGMLIDICRILGTTNQYLAAGGVKGDSHFPWHSLSNLSKIRQDLDVWASGTEDVFSSLESLFGQPDSTVLVLSKLIYHLIHCLIYRPFLPIDLAELAGSGQHQSWQIEATNMCFLHANAIAELVQLGKQTPSVEWPAFVGYCICTAGTVHIHGAHYSRIGGAGDVNVFSSSPDFLSREMQQLSELRYAWASVQHQRETLQSIYNAHSELVKSLAHSPMRYSPAFHLEDFFDRYSNIGGPGGRSFSFDAANLSLADVAVDFTADTFPGQSLYAPRLSLKRKNTAPSGRPRPDLKNLVTMNDSNMKPPPTPSTATHPLFSPASLPPQPSPGMLHTPTTLTSPHGIHPPNRHMSVAHAGTDAVAGFSMGGGGSSSSSSSSSNPSEHPHGSSFNVGFNFGGPLRGGGGGGGGGSTPGPGNGAGGAGAGGGFDPVFGGGFATNAAAAAAFPSPAASTWQHGSSSSGCDDDGAVATTASRPLLQGSTTTTTSPAQQQQQQQHHHGTSPHESTATTGGGADEKDPFLSLLEQLAENESFMGGGGGTGSDLDFFLSGAPSTG